MAEFSPAEILDQAGVPRWLRLEEHSLAALARDHRLALKGPDLAIRSLVPLSLLPSDQSALTYLSSARYASDLKDVSRQAVITTPQLSGLVPAGNALLLTDGNPRELFYTVLGRLIRSGRFDRMQSYISPSARIHPSACLAREVYVDDDAEIGACAVVLANTYVGKGVVLKPNCTIGGDGFELAVIEGRRRVVPHAGGVWLCDGAQIGSSTCVDKGLWGDFTYVGAETVLDNLIHFAHSASCGRACSLVASCEISGSVRLGDGVWIGPNVTINQGLRIGSHAYLGSAAVITRDVPPFSLAYGSPAKVMARVCACRNKIEFSDNKARCSQCGGDYLLTQEGVQRVR